MPSDKELSKKSDEHKALLAQKCVDLLMRKTGLQDEVSEVKLISTDITSLDDNLWLGLSN